jgi:hypothetical protein
VTASLRAEKKLNKHWRIHAAYHYDRSLSVQSADAPLVAEVELLYQSVPPETVTPLLQQRGLAAMAFKKHYSTVENRPEVVRRMRLKL